MAKAQNAKEATDHLTNLESRKRADFEAKRDDKTNKVQTIALQEEVSHRQREGQLARASVNTHVRSSLDHQKFERASKAQVDKKADFQGDIATTGLEFECYTRDPMVSAERRRTQDFQRGQMDAEKLKRVQQREDEVKPDSTTLSDLQIAEMRSQAESQHKARREQLGKTMQDQYRSSISSRISERQEQRAREAAEAARQREAVQQQEQWEREAKVA